MYYYLNLKLIFLHSRLYSDVVSLIYITSLMRLGLLFRLVLIFLRMSVHVPAQFKMADILASYLC